MQKKKQKITARITAARTIAPQRLVASGIGLAIVAALILPMGLTGAYAQQEGEEEGADSGGEGIQEELEEENGEEEERLTTTIEIDSAELNRDGTVTVTYTVSCSEEATLIESFARVQQTVGKRFGEREVSGLRFSEDRVACDESGVSVTQTIIAERGFFVPGRATVLVVATACLEGENCDIPEDEQVVSLRR